MAGAVGCSFCGHVGFSTLDDVKVGQDLVMWPELTKKQKKEKLKSVSDMSLQIQHQDSLNSIPTWNKVNSADELK